MYMKKRRYSIADARATLPGIVRAAERGDSIEITRRGQPVAVVISIETRDRLLAGHKGFADAFDEFLARSDEAVAVAPAAYFDGLRDRGPGRSVKL
jgi:prevent-host-death family protein